MSMMGQIATLSDQLATMPDNMLGRIAQQYKNDAVSLSLILNEKNRREKLRMAQAGQAGQQPAPKVNDQVIASMAPHQLPENVGIGALPAPNMEHMAAGGLVAFADGGDVEHYANEGQVRPQGMINYGGAYGGANLIPDTTGYEGLSLAEAWDKLIDSLPSEEKTMAKRRKAEEIAKQDALVKANYRPRSNVTQGERDVAMEKAGFTPGAEAPPSPPAPQLKTVPGAPAVGSTGPYNASGLEALQNKFMADVDTRYDSLETRYGALGKMGEDVANAALAREKQRQTAEGDVYAGRAQRLQERETALGKQGEENKGLAFLEAGLAIMSTPGSLLTAIGKGARVGTEKYASGLEKLRAAQERLGDAKDALDTLRLNRSDMKQSRIDALEQRLDAAKYDTEKLALEGFKDVTGRKAADARDLFGKVSDLYKTQYTEGEQTKRTNAHIAAAQNTPQMQEWLGYLKANGNDPVAAGKAYRSANAEKFNPYDAYVKILTAYAGKDENIVGKPPTFAEFAAQFAMPTSVPKGAKVYND